MVPVRIKSPSGAYLAKELYSISDILPLIRADKTEVDLDGDKVHVSTLRLRCFLRSGLKCVSCGIVGQFFRKERHPHQDRYHLNMYGLDEVGREVMLTADHIIPISLGGRKYALSNVQTMCEPCNQRKGNGQPKSVRTKWNRYISEAIGCMLFCMSQGQHVHPDDDGWVSADDLRAAIAKANPKFEDMPDEQFDRALRKRRTLRVLEVDDTHRRVRVPPVSMRLKVCTEAEPPEILWYCAREYQMDVIMRRGLHQPGGGFTPLMVRSSDGSVGGRVIYRKHGHWVKVRARDALRQGVKFFMTPASYRWISTSIPLECLEDAGYMSRFYAE